MIYNSAHTAKRMSADLGALGIELGVTLFHNGRAQSLFASLLNLPEVLRDESAATSGEPFELQLARYERPAYAVTVSVDMPVAISGVELAFGAGDSPDEAAGMMAERNLGGMIIAPGADGGKAGGFFVLFPLSEERPAGERIPLAARGNGALPGPIVSEWKPSLRAPEIFTDARLWLVDGRPLDLCHDLAENAVGPDGDRHPGCRALSAEIDVAAHLDGQHIATELVSKALRSIANASPEARNETLVREVYALGVLAAYGLLSVDEIVDIVIEQAHESGYCDLHGGFETRRTIRAAAAAGWCHPNPMPLRDLPGARTLLT